jgi:outer membrane protein assembly factor BamB
VAGAGVVLACAPKAAPVYAVKLGGRGRLADSELAWKSTTRPVSSDVCTPLFYQDRFYVLNGERRALSRIVPATGAVEWTGELGRGAKIETSPTGADGKIYFMDHRATVQVVEAGPAFKILHTVNLATKAKTTCGPRLPWRGVTCSSAPIANSFAWEAEPLRLRIAFNQNCGRDWSADLSPLPRDFVGGH